MQAAHHSQPNGVCLATVGGAVSYERTAFLSSSGNDGTAVLNDPDLPFLTNDAAVDALAVAYAGQTTTLRYLSNNTSNLAPSANLNTLLAAGLTMRSHDATVRTLSGSISFGDAAGALLTQIKIILSGTVTKAFHIGQTVESAGTITGDADSSIAELVISADATPPAAGATGQNGENSGGSNGGNGIDADYPTAGENGGSANASGSPGEAGGQGNRAWNLTLAGNLTIALLTGVGGPGGAAGSGGVGAIALGGNGGNGGNSNHPTDPVDGGAGGAGGDATANGGDGGVGGTGGAGSTVTKGASVTITSHVLTGGSGGLGGSSGPAGSATGGTGGTGGTGANGGNSGASGAAGASVSNAGGNGANGSAGTNGSIV